MTYIQQGETWATTRSKINQVIKVSYTDLLADTELTYTGGASGTVTAGDLYPTTEGNWFEVAASDAVDQHITTAGGVKLYEAGPQFSTRARAVAAWERMVARSETPPVGTVWTWPGASIVYDGSATALTGFSGWSPMAPLHMQHFNVFGDANTSDTSCPSEATTDETSGVQAAFDYALENGLQLHGDLDRVYGVSDTVIFGMYSGISAVQYGAKLSHVNLSALASANWSSGDVTDADPGNWTFGNAVLVVGRDPALSSGKHQLPTERVHVSGSQRAAVSLLYYACSQSLHQACGGYRATEACVLVSKPTAPDSASCTDSAFVGLRAYEFEYTTDVSDGFNDLTLRTAAGLHHNSADVKYFGCVFSGSKHSLALGDFFNAQWSDCVAYNGPVRTDAGSKTLVVSAAANRYQFVNCRIDDGQTRLLSFNGHFVGCRFIQYAAAEQLALEATSANEDAQDFVFVGNTLDDSAALMATSGSGSWGTVLAAIAGNTRAGSTSLFTIDGIASRAGGLTWFGNTGGTITGTYGLDLVTFTQDIFELRGSRGIGIMADADNNAGAASSEFWLGADGNWYHVMRNSGFWNLFHDAATGGGAVVQMGHSGDDFWFAPTNASGGIDYTKEFKFDQSAGVWLSETPFRVLTTTVSGLPSASTAGAGSRAVVTDATATTFASTVTGGGANTVPVFSDGTNWVIG